MKKRLLGILLITGLLLVWFYSFALVTLWYGRNSASQTYFAPSALSKNLNKELKYFLPLDQPDEPQGNTVIRGTKQFLARENFKGVHLNGPKGDFIDLSKLDNIDFQKEYTISFWVWPDEIQEGEVKSLYNLVWIGNSQHTTSPLFSFWIRMWNQSLHYSAQGNSFDVDGISLHTFHPFEVVISNDLTKGISLWIDGNQIENPYILESSSISAFDYPLDTAQIGLGSSPQTGLSGIYGGLLVWSRALDEKEIKELSQGGGLDIFRTSKVQRFKLVEKLVRFFAVAGVLNLILINLILKVKNSKQELFLLLLVNDAFFLYATLFF